MFFSVYFLYYLLLLISPLLVCYNHNKINEVIFV